MVFKGDKTFKVVNIMLYWMEKHARLSVCENIGKVKVYCALTP